MAVSVRIESVAKDVDVLVGDLKGTAASQFLAEFAREQIEEVKNDNASVLGRVPPFKVFVDGQANASIDSVKPNGVVVAEFELVSDVLIWISQQLTTHSPVKSGRYKRSHILFADGVEIDAQAKVIPVAAQYVFTNTVKYARKIETGMSSSAPDGVYQGVAVLARQKYRSIARISYTFMTIAGGERNPSIIVTPN
jgi:hypothetical protein